MNRHAPVDHPIHEHLRQRWSPYVFDASRSVSENDMHALLEAARWTMSSYNAQPWRYIVGVRERDPETWQKVLDCLVEGNQVWAKEAPVLMLGLTQPHFEHNGKPNKAAEHDLGAASAMLTVEATARGLKVHQMIGIEPDKAHELFGLDESVKALTGLAIGYAGKPATADEKLAERDRKPRERKPLRDIVRAGSV